MKSFGGFTQFLSWNVWRMVLAIRKPGCFFVFVFFFFWPPFRLWSSRGSDRIWAPAAVEAQPWQRGILNPQLGLGVEPVSQLWRDALDPVEPQQEPQGTFTFPFTGGVTLGNEGQGWFFEHPAGCRFLEWLRDLSPAVRLSGCPSINLVCSSINHVYPRLNVLNPPELPLCKMQRTIMLTSKGSFDDWLRYLMHSFQKYWVPSLQLWEGQRWSGEENSGIQAIWSLKGDPR